MAIIIGGLHGRAAGNVGGIIYGAARSRIGKVVTAREYVIPANPQTAAQQNQRDKFKSSMMTVRAIGPDTYQDHWNRSVGQLPGFHSLESILLHVISDENEYDDPPADTPLGTLHFPVSVAWAMTGPTEITCTYSTEAGDNGAAADVAHLRAIKALPETDLDHQVHEEDQPVTRADGAGLVRNLGTDTDYLVFFWLDGPLLGTARLTRCEWALASTAT